MIRVELNRGERRGCGEGTFRLAGLLCLLTLAAAPALTQDTNSTAALPAAGLREPVEVVTDRWGIAHIYARNERDLFFAQGYNAARDRLFQFELWRRQATGTLAEVLGQREVKRDRGARLFRFRGDLRREMRHYHPRGEQIIPAFVDGVNACIADAVRDPARLPLELRLLGITPQPWTPEVVLSRHAGLLQNAVQELHYGRAVARLGAEKVRELVYFHPGEPVLDLDPALDRSLLDEDLLGPYTAFRAAIAFRPEDLMAPRVSAAGMLFQPPGLERSAAAEPVPEGGGGTPEDIGSNNWAVSGRLTHSGFPLLANDPHRAQQVPSLRYFVHLVAPGWNVIGGGEPVLPGVSIGHNEHGAWGLTVFSLDSEDLYVYDLHPTDPLRYRYRDGWERMRVVRESIPVKGAVAAPVELKYTRHGPVLFEDASRKKAVALRAGWLDTGSAPYLSSLRMNQSRTWAEFREACAAHRIPGENMVWADRSGTIGWQAAGLAPVRPNWSGLVPVPGDGRYEWRGYLPGKRLPHAENPPEGFLATANSNLVPPGYPHRNAVGWGWAEPFRAHRIREVLASGRKHSLADMKRLQHDELSLPARALVPLLKDLPVEDPRSRRAVELLLGWDHVLDRDSVPAAIYTAWVRRLQRNVRALVLPTAPGELFPVPGAGSALLPSIPMKRILEWLEAPDGRFGRDPLAGRDALLLRSLREGLDDLTTRLGPDLAAWRYGQPRFKHSLLRHPLGTLVDPQTRTRLDVGPAPRGGDSFTVNNTGAGDNQSTGASFRVILDTEDWDNSIATNTPGQSGDPASPHYADLFPLWASGRYFPLFYSRKRVDSVAERVWKLVPPSR